MPKNRKALPKRIAGFKVPKGLRKSRLLRSLLGSELGRQIVADALVAGAGAAATVLVREREEATGAVRAGARRGKARFSVATEAVESAADAVMGVVTDAARGMLPEEKPARRGRARKPAGGNGAVRH
jgi:hypothetical protein